MGELNIIIIISGDVSWSQLLPLARRLSCRPSECTLRPGRLCLVGSSWSNLANCRLELEALEVWKKPDQSLG